MGNENHKKLERYILDHLKGDEVEEDAFTADTVEGAYGAQTFARLRAAKHTWDPGNLFRHNHNIPPAA